MPSDNATRIRHLEEQVNEAIAKAEHHRQKHKQLIAWMRAHDEKLFRQAILDLALEKDLLPSVERSSGAPPGYAPP